MEDTVFFSFVYNSLREKKVTMANYLVPAGKNINEGTLHVNLTQGDSENNA